MENNNKVFKTYSEVNESLEKIESFLNIVETNMNDVKTFGIGVLMFFDKDLNELRAVLEWVVDATQNNIEKEFIDQVKTSSKGIYEKMRSIHHLINDNEHKDTNKWLNIVEPPTVTGTYNATVRIASTESIEYKVVQVYYDLDTKKWYIVGDTNDLIIMWFKNN